MNRCARSLSVLTIFILVVTFATSAAAEEVERNDGTDSSSEDLQLQAPFGAGNIDINAGLGGSNSLIYLNAEPGINVGLVGPSDAVVLSAGASLNLGYCLACHLLDLADVRVRASNMSPMIRGTVHLPALARAIDEPELDIRVGLMGGIANYRLDIGDRNGEVEIDARVRTTLIGPYLGGTYSFTDGRGPFGFADARYLFEVGTASVTINAGDDDEERVLDVQADVSRRGLETVVGLGYRF